MTRPKARPGRTAGPNRSTQQHPHQNPTGQLVVVETAGSDGTIATRLGLPGTFGRLFRIVHLADAVLGKEFQRHGLQPGWFDVRAALRCGGRAYERNPTDVMGARRSSPRAAWRSDSIASKRPALSSGARTRAIAGGTRAAHTPRQGDRRPGSRAARAQRGAPAGSPAVSREARDGRPSRTRLSDLERADEASPKERRLASGCSVKERAMAAADAALPSKSCRSSRSGGVSRRSSSTRRRSEGSSSIASAAPTRIRRSWPGLPSALRHSGSRTRKTVSREE
jgi:hypothetical protein